MADRFYGVNEGGQVAVNVSESAATTGRQVELRISDTIYSKKLAVQLAMKALWDYIATKETNPIA
jgi:hypothetical protein